MALPLDWQVRLHTSSACWHPYPTSHHCGPLEEPRKQPVVLTMKDNVAVFIMPNGQQVDPLPQPPMAAPGEVAALGLPTGRLLLHAALPAL